LAIRVVALDVCDWIIDRECDAKGESCGAIVFVKRQKNTRKARANGKELVGGCSVFGEEN